MAEANKEFLIRPYAPLLFRDNRPFDADAGAETLAFPRPSTIAGAIRNAFGEQTESSYDQQELEKLRNIQLKGPFLVSVCADDKAELLLPKPEDALQIAIGTGDNKKVAVHRLVPRTVATDEFVNLASALRLVIAPEGIKGKPVRDPVFWTWAELQKWLNDAPVQEVVGAPGLAVDRRTHVALKKETRTAKDKDLYQTSGLDLGPRYQEKTGGWSADQYAWLVQVASEPELKACFRSLGGERRLAYLQELKEDVLPQYKDPGIVGQKKFRLFLATPAVFTHGWIPDDIDSKTWRGSLLGIKVQLRAAAVGRWEAQSGWDMTKSGKAAHKSLQRAVPAGTVYWFEADNELTAEDVKELWLQSICTAATQQNDGFGLVLPGRWLDQEGDNQ